MSRSFEARLEWQRRRECPTVTVLLNRLAKVGRDGAHR